MKRLLSPSRRKAASLLALAVLGAGLALWLTRGSGTDRGDGPPTLADYWAGRASLVLDRKWTSAALGAPGGGAYEGAHIEIAGPTWYLFNRRREAGPCAGQAPEVRQLGTQVRASSDGGRSWGPPEPVVSPTPGTPWSCAATDGDATFDRATRTWRYLFQCLGDAGEWSGCLVQRRAASPVGPFEVPKDPPNPVIPSGSLWGRICDDEGDGCRRPPGERPIADEGTFDIFAADEDGWWVGFHGFDGRQGYRGLARTKTFRPGDWLVDGAGGTPTDAIVDAADATGWRESWGPGGPVGAGASRIVREGDWHYQVVEVPDQNLTCQPGQNWDFGLLRTRDLSAERWQQLPAGNPIVYSSREADASGRSPACNVQYPSLFVDPAKGITYLLHGRVAADPAQDGLYLYRLEWDRNELRNGDFRTADVAGWRAFPGTTTQLAAERATPTALDGTPDLTFNCGGTGCTSDASVFQDLSVRDGLRGRTVAFGGAFRGDEVPGELNVGLLQLGADGAVLRSSTLTVAVGTAYRAARSAVEVDRRARRLRFQLFPRSPGTLRADDLFVLDQSGCDRPRFPAC